jgi:hypothetical protein
MILNPIFSIDNYHQEKFGCKHPKIQRGWGQIYDVIFNELGDKIDVITEIGIGNASCQVAWAKTFPGKKVVGLDIASPSLQLCDQKNCDVRQYINSVTGVNNVHNLNIPDIANIDVYYGKDAYDNNVADQYLEVYGKQIFFINDGKQDGLVHMKFAKVWSNLLLPGGLLLQERIGRAGFEGIRIHQLQKAISNGWLIYDCREFVEFENPNSNGFLGIWSHDNAYWDKVLRDFKRITNPVAEIEKQHHILDENFTQ